MVMEGRGLTTDPAMRRSNQAPRDGFNDINVDCVAEGLAGSALGFGKMLQAAHALQARAFAHGHVAAFPWDNGDLARGERHERGSCRRPLGPNARGSKLYDGVPKITRTVLPIPFELLKAGGEV